MSELEHTSPTCHIVAGPNGAGKTTFAMSYLHKIVDCSIYINADEIAKEISPNDVSAGRLQAGRIFLKQLDEQIASRQDFAFETTLSGKVYLIKIPIWRALGWKVILHFLWVPSSAFSIERVKMRVSQGGHNIPEEDILRRYSRSISNIFSFSEICDETYCYDNSGVVPDLIFTRIDGLERIFNQEKYLKIKMEIPK